MDNLLLSPSLGITKRLLLLSGDGTAVKEVVKKYFKMSKPPAPEILEGKAITSDVDRGINKVYVVKNGMKHWISSPEEFVRLGFKGEDIQRLPESMINAISEGNAIGETVYDIRFGICSPFIHGRGIEIGAGPHPQSLPDGANCEYFDKRDDRELDEYFGDETGENVKLKVYPIEKISERFPKQADFLIAHNVLEHSSNPIRTLIDWHSYVKDSGTLILSLPYHECCPDKGRNPAPFEHIVCDYLLDRDDLNYESKEHIYSYIMGWIDEGGFKGKSKFEVSGSSHQCAKSENNDLHWHVYTEDVLQKIIQFSALCSRKNVSFERIAAPYKNDKDCRTTCEIIIIYRIFNAKLPSIDSSLMHDINNLRNSFSDALEVLNEVSRNF